MGRGVVFRLIVFAKFPHRLSRFSALLGFPASIIGSMTIRPLQPDDLPAVAQLFQRNFRDPRSAAPQSLELYLGKLFLDHPWYDPDIAARVHCSAAGRVNGFLGVLPLKMRFRGRAIRAAVAGSLVVEEPSKNPLAGALLLRSFVNGPQDLSISETANTISQALWARLGGEPLPLYSMEWMRVLQPARAGVSLLAEAVPAAKLLRPIASLADRALSYTARNPFRLKQMRSPTYEHDAEVDDATFMAAVQRFASTCALKPDWDGPTLAWVLSHSARKERHGKLMRRLVYGGAPEPIGGYLCYGRPGGVAWVLQILAEPQQVVPILDSLMTHAVNLGSVAVRGRTHPAIMKALMGKGCIFFHRSATIVRARDPELVSAIDAGDAFITGLAAEAWTRLIGDVFV